MRHPNWFWRSSRRSPASVTQAACLLLPAAFISLFLTTNSAADDGPSNPFQGEWRTTISLVKLEQKGNEVTGTYGNAGQYTIRGTAKGNVLTFEHAEGQVKGDGKFTIDATGNAFEGSFQIRNGQAGNWNGWRPDPKARSAGGKPAAFGGLWLTDLGLLDLTQNGQDVAGKIRPAWHVQLERQSDRPRARLQIQQLQDRSRLV